VLPGEPDHDRLGELEEARALSWVDDAVEIDAIRADLLDAVNRAVQPTHASVRVKS
jgi:hypothetical protein